MKNNPLEQNSSDCDAAASSATRITKNSFAYEVLSLSLPTPRSTFVILKHGGNRPPASVGKRGWPTLASLLHLCLHIKEFNAGTTQSQPGKASRWNGAKLLGPRLTRFLAAHYQAASVKLIETFCISAPSLCTLGAKLFQAAALSGFSDSFYIYFFILVSLKFTKSYVKAKRHFCLKKITNNPFGIRSRERTETDEAKEVVTKKRQRES